MAIPRALPILLSAVLFIAACGSSGEQGSLALPGNSAAKKEHAHPRKHRGVAHAHAGRTHVPGKAASAAAAPAAAGSNRVAFIRRADRVCRTAHARVGRLGRRLAALAAAVAKQQLKPAAYYARSAALTHRSADIAGGTVKQLSQLAAGLADRNLSTYLSAATTQADLLHREGDALGDADSKRARTVNGELAKTARRLHAAARSFGFRTCGGG
jgi:hypothetical protein